MARTLVPPLDDQRAWVFVLLLRCDDGRPFGNRFERDVNILKGAKCLDGLEGFEKEGSKALDVIGKMLSPEAHERVETLTCLLHPYFWDSGKRLNFLHEASAWFDTMCRNPQEPLLIELERGIWSCGK
ncbi:hypothetical protein BDY19DRAFT_1034269 [Irpex rosettiformis]|uniref:Uncharacterized protein n=1 Tax=Irpex rosettiformis TaxID=378272 RepID=A0ACB8TMN8_9APHY|nr:hypothetical protein BDY19DRAFT_1034269 [Irpex rosettiformis]